MHPEGLGLRNRLWGSRWAAKHQGGAVLAVRTGRFPPNSPPDPLEHMLTQGQTLGAWVEGLYVWGES